MFKNQRWFFRKARRPVEVLPFSGRLSETVKRRTGLDIPHLNGTRHGGAEEELAPGTVARLRRWMARDVAYWEELVATPG
jgi:hypothetical protein